MLSISIVGAGRLGGSLALALDRAGFRIENLFYRSTKPTSALSDLLTSSVIASLSDDVKISSDIILITTQDAAIVSAAGQIVSLIKGSPTVFITSGAIASSEIAFLRKNSCEVGSIHPLVSVSDSISGSDRFKGTYFCVEGDAKAVENAHLLVKSLGGHPFSIDTDKKPLYHAAAVTASGHLVALLDTAVEMLEKCGIDRGSAKRILLPLITSTIENLDQQGIEASLTGPFARGDGATFERHLATLKENTTTDERQIYLNLAERSLEIALRLKGTDAALLDLQKKVSMAKKELR